MRADESSLHRKPTYVCVAALLMALAPERRFMSVGIGWWRRAAWSVSDADIGPSNAGVRYRLAHLQVHVPLGRSKLRDQRPERPVTGPTPASGLQRALKTETARILGTCTCASAHTAARLCSGFTALRVRKSSCGIDHCGGYPGGHLSVPAAVLLSGERGPSGSGVP
jgi:hypothetical protein